MNEPTCPICGDSIEYIDTFDTYIDTNDFEALCVGECPTCGREYQWKDVYKFSHVKDLKEVH